MSGDKVRVLIVEDEPSLRLLNQIVLERSGHFRVVGQAGDGAEAINQAEKLQPDLILLDLAMPRMDGIEALPYLRVAAPNSKVVALSMLQRDRYEKEALHNGAAAFLDKGTDSRTLIKCLLDLAGRDSRGGAAGGGAGGSSSGLGARVADWWLRFPLWTGPATS